MKEGRKESRSFINKSAITEKVYRPNLLVKRSALGLHKKMKLWLYATTRDAAKQELKIKE